MSHINVTINGRQYRMACEEGQEVRLLKLAESLETRVGELRGKFGEIGDARLTVMAALTVCDELLDANVLIVIAGMEGALPSVVGGLVDKPVIAVPTSVGYGASFGGIAALLAMLNSCASGVTVVNINNGFGAGYAASLINQLAQ